VTRKQDSARGKITGEDLKRLLAEDRDLLKVIVEETLQQVREAEMDEALQASKSERTAGRLGYRAGYYNRMLVTRVGHIELRVPQDRQGRFRTEVFERYQRSEKALVAAMLEMYVQGVSTRKVKTITEGAVRPRVQFFNDQPDRTEAGRRTGTVRPATTGRALPVSDSGCPLREGSRGWRGPQPGGADRDRNQLGRATEHFSGRTGQPGKRIELEGTAGRLAAATNSTPCNERRKTRPIFLVSPFSL